jgi:transcription elongation factor GreA
MKKKSLWSAMAMKTMTTAKYLITSPIGRGLLGKKKGEVAEIAVPKGVIKFKVLEIEYEDA